MTMTIEIGMMILPLVLTTAIWVSVMSVWSDGFVFVLQRRCSEGAPLSQRRAVIAVLDMGQHLRWSVSNCWVWHTNRPWELSYFNYFELASERHSRQYQISVPEYLRIPRPFILMEECRDSGEAPKRFRVADDVSKPKPGHTYVSNYLT